MGIHKVHPYLLLIADNSMLLLSYPSYPFPFSLTSVSFPAKLKAVIRWFIICLSFGAHLRVSLKHFISDNKFARCIETTIEKLHLSYSFGTVVPLYLSRGQLSAAGTTIRVGILRDAGVNSGIFEIPCSFTFRGQPYFSST